MTTFRVHAVSPTLPKDDLQHGEPGGAADALAMAEDLFDPGTPVIVFSNDAKAPRIGNPSSDVTVAQYGDTKLVLGGERFLKQPEEQNFFHFEYNDTGESIDLRVSGPIGEREITGTDESPEELCPPTWRAADIGGEWGANGDPLSFEQAVLDRAKQDLEAEAAQADAAQADAEDLEEEEDEMPPVSALMWFDEFCAWAVGFNWHGFNFINETPLDLRDIESWQLREVPADTPGAHRVGDPISDQTTAPYATAETQTPPAQAATRASEPDSASESAPKKKKPSFWSRLFGRDR
ncbi:MAG: hypothetical protein ACTHXA_04310 [Gulosibacter sp.]|uniref:hypothetical protein n=1 Tax=Gulosibacter sp. TaxID=2817531 RepID=UPI003F8E473F